jgi:hypothetical protein
MLKPDALISFNYDTLLEQNLSRGGWTYSEPVTGSAQTWVLKPHGSVSWVHRVSLVDGVADQVDLGKTLKPGQMGYEKDWLVQNLVVGLRAKVEHTVGERSWEIRRLFGTILRGCERAVAEASKIWVVGYRFAPADRSFLDVMARALARRTGPPSVGVIDFGSPGRLLPWIQHLFAMKIDGPLRYCFCGFRKWAEHGFCHHRASGS